MNILSFKAALLKCTGIIAAAGLLASASAAQTPSTAQTETTAPYIKMDGEQLETQVERLNAYVRSISTIRGQFVQSTSSGDLQTGTFFWKRPDQLRIEYDTTPLLIVADGSNIAQIDKELETIEQIRIGWTPYKFLLARKFDLRKGAELVGLERTESASFATLRDKDGDLDGDFTMIFSEPELKLLGWTWENAFDGKVSFVLSDIAEGEKLNPALFVIREEERRRGGRRR